jgi:hypothetical protein
MNEKPPSSQNDPFEQWYSEQFSTEDNSATVDDHERNAELDLADIVEELCQFFPERLGEPPSIELAKELIEEFKSSPRTLEFRESLDRYSEEIEGVIVRFKVIEVMARLAEGTKLQKEKDQLQRDLFTLLKEDVARLREMASKHHEEEGIKLGLEKIDTLIKRIEEDYISMDSARNSIDDIGRPSSTSESETISRLGTHIQNKQMSIDHYSKELGDLIEKMYRVIKESGKKSSN